MPRPANREEYSRGYERGWRDFASRWRLVIDRGSVVGSEGDWICCRKDESSFQRGYEDGQLAAGAAATQIEMKCLSVNRGRGEDP